MPSTQKNRQAGTAAGSLRRTFLNRLWALAAVLACMEFGWLAGSLLNLRSKKTAQARQLIDAGTTDSLLPGQVKAVPAGALYIVCLDDGSFMALSRTCTHLGCAIPWDAKAGQFTCPCHGSSFDITGTVLNAPAIRPLDFYPVRIENGRLRVDITRPLRRERFDPAQAVRL